jgi:hypothetical protein
VDWNTESNCGSISNDGVFTAGSDNGPCKVTANVAVGKVSKPAVVYMLIGDAKPVKAHVSRHRRMRGATRIAGNHTVILPQRFDGIATLTDASGQTAYATAVNGTHVRIPALAGGVYVLQISEKLCNVRSRITIPK